MEAGGWLTIFADDLDPQKIDQIITSGSFIPRSVLDPLNIYSDEIMPTYSKIFGAPLTKNDNFRVKCFSLSHTVNDIFE